MKILITGITGFIGQRLLSQMKKEDEVFVLCRKDLSGLPRHVSALKADLNEPGDLWEKLKSIRPDVCVHLAWEGIPDYGLEISRRNLEQTSRLWRHLAEECGCRKIISTGTCWEYGKSFGVCREDDPVVTHAYFTWAKRCLADLGGMLAAKQGIAFIWARIFYAYGPGQRHASLVPMIVEALKNNVMPAVQTPHNANDFVYVDDIAQALGLMAYKNIPTGVYNLGSGKAIEVWRVCEYLEKVMGLSGEWSKGLCASKVQPTANFWADTSKTADILGWESTTDMEDGLRRYLKNREIKV